MQFLQARYYSPQTAKRRIDFIVLHDMEMAERVTTAEACAAFFHKGPPSPASAHYCVDSDSIVQCVRENDIAYHAPPNTHSLGIEHAGYARQTRAEWLDQYGQAMLTLSAKLTAELCQKYNLPVTFLSPADLKAGKRGITTHANVSQAWHQTTHTDPGPNFPIDWYLKQVRAARVPPAPPAVNPTPKPAPVPTPTNGALTLLLYRTPSVSTAYEVTGASLVAVTKARADAVRAAGVNVEIVVVPDNDPLWKLPKA